MAAYKVLQEHLAWEISDGNFARFWSDDWRGDGRLSDLCLLRIEIQDLFLSVTSCSSNYSSWDDIPYVISFQIPCTGEAAVGCSSGEVMQSTGPSLDLGSW